MGINLSFLPFFDKCHEYGHFQGPLLAFGSQEIHTDPDTVRSFAVHHGYHDLTQNPTVKNLFAARYGINDYRDMDLNTDSALHVDLGKTLDRSYQGSAQTLLNAGTLEHIFNIHQALANAHDMVKSGGCIVHIAPVTWYNHAFYNINPKLFTSVASANNYEMLLEAFHFSADPFPGEKKEQQLLYFTRVKEPDVAVRERINGLLNAQALPPNVLYLCAQVKINDASFTIPYEIQD